MLPTTQYVPPQPYAPVPSRKRSSSIKWVFLIVGGIVGVCCLSGVGLAALGIYGERTEPVSASERELLLTVDNLRGYVDVASDSGAHEIAEKHIDLLGGIELYYEWTDFEQQVYVQCSMLVESSTQGASDFYSGASIGIDLGLAIDGSGLRAEEIPNGFSWGDRSKHSLLVSEDGSPVGTFFITRTGRRVFYVVIGGVYADDPQILRELLEPHLLAMESYDG